MTLKPFFFVAISLFFCGNFPTSVGFPGLGDIQTYANFVNDAIGILKGDLPFTALFTGSTGPTLDKILDSVSDISKQIDDFGDEFRAQLDAQSKRMDERFDEVNAKLDKILTDLPLQGKVVSMTRELHSYMIRIDDLYSKYERYAAGRENFNNYTIKTFIEAATSARRGDLDDILARMMALIIPERSAGFTDGIFDILGLHMINNGHEICGSRKSAQMYLFDIYESVVVSETRGFIMSIFAYALISVYKRTSFNSELDFRRDQLIKRVDSYLKITIQSMEGVPRNIELCDAPQYVKGVNYVRFETPYKNQTIKGRSISRLVSISDINNNMIISGIRFVYHNVGMIDCQTQQARLLPQGLIDNRNQTWSQLPNITFKSNFNTLSGDFLYENGTLLRAGKEFFPMHSAMEWVMADLVLPRDYVLAGLSFRRISSTISGLRIRGVKFDYATGELNPEDTVWISPTKWTQNPKFSVTAMQKKGSPTDATSNVVDTKPGDIIPITDSNGKNPEVLPFLDARSVTLAPISTAVSGLGVFHRGTPNFGGYINFRLISLNLLDYLKA